MTDAPFQGSGWAFPIGVAADGSGMIARTADGDAAIRDSIWAILGTAPGERVMRPDFGCSVVDLVFSLVDAATAGEISWAVTQALGAWEPRIDVLDVTTAPDPAESRRLLIDISYRVRQSNSRRNLVYPFYLE